MERKSWKGRLTHSGKMVKKNQNFFQVGVREIDVTTERSQEAMSLQGRSHILFYQVEYELSITEVDIFNTVEILVHYESVTQGSWNNLDGDGQCTLRRGGEMKDEDRQRGWGVYLYIKDRGENRVKMRSSVRNEQLQKALHQRRCGLKYLNTQNIKRPYK